jgi:uncharacterized membrane protein YjjP (DUF1212 family)
MEKAAEGLTGQRGVNFLLLPRKAFFFTPTSGTTFLFFTGQDFCINIMDSMEPVVVRLASFASNTHGVDSVPARLPRIEELRKAFCGQSAIFSVESQQSKEELAAEILSLASDAEGLFFFVNTSETLHGIIDKFWKVDESTRDVFSRLATIEAMDSIDKIDADAKVLYSPLVMTIFRLCSSAGACAIWFHGSWQDMFVAGILAIVVAYIGSWPLLSNQERIIFEVVASFVVGLTAGLIELTWPNNTCFRAMAISSVLELLQGFTIVYAIVEVMSKHTVAGGADFLEGILFTGLIAYFLKFGLYVVRSEDTEGFQCINSGINAWWYFLFVPLAALSWSGLFMPNYRDLPLMTFHGVLAYVFNWGLAYNGVNEQLNNFVSSVCVTLSAGIISRFTGRQAVGNTIAGLYALLPGAYAVATMYSSEADAFYTGVLINAILIGLGAWTGTMLCSPTVFGTTSGLLTQASKDGGSTRGGGRERKERSAMLFF